MFAKQATAAIVSSLSSCSGSPSRSLTRRIASSLCARISGESLSIPFPALALCAAQWNKVPWNSAGSVIANANHPLWGLTGHQLATKVDRTGYGISINEKDRNRALAENSLWVK
jgi:hypothetical protein